MISFLPKKALFEDLISQDTRNWILNGCLMLIIFLTAEVGKMLGIHDQPLGISVVWPATGFALAAMILFGFRCWPGIFLGNFLFNMLHLYVGSHAFLGPLIVACIKSGASLSQALLGSYIVRRYTSPNYFSTLRDTVIFLIAAGVLPCLIAPSLSIPTLYVYGAIGQESLWYDWITFFVGDTMGVYIFTPLLIVWSTQRFRPRCKGPSIKCVAILIAFILLTVLSFIHNYPIAHLLIPLSLLVTYQYRLHGATLIIFLTALISILATDSGHGSFAAYLVSLQLTILVVFLEVLVATTLLFGAAVHERDVALHVIDQQKRERETLLFYTQRR